MWALKRTTSRFRAPRVAELRRYCQRRRVASSSRPIQSTEEQWEVVAKRFNIDSINIKPIEELLPKFGEAKVKVGGLLADFTRTLQQMPVGINDSTAAERMILAHRLIERAVAALTEPLCVRVDIANNATDFVIKAVHPGDDLARFICVVAGDSTDSAPWKMRARCVLYPDLYEMSQPWLENGMIPAIEDDEVHSEDADYQTETNYDELPEVRIREYDDYGYIRRRGSTNKQTKRERAPRQRTKPRHTSSLLLPPVAGVMTTLSEWVFVRYVPSSSSPIGTFYESEEISVDLSSTETRQHRNMVLLLAAALS